ncbi:ECF subfamily RNA polymerase sigma-24 factor [Flammeovirgaceae bacterium 311]|nr:ECF subfamily RNA polymerase sigma-24 factor [Flammeovirgaceae bacterium 311]
MSEKEMIINLKSGSQQAFNLLFHLYERRLYAFSYKFLHSREDAEEVVQEVFFKVWKNKRLLNEELSFKAYLFTIAKNHIYNLMSKRVSDTCCKKYFADTTSNQVHTTEDALNFNEANTIIQEKVNSLSAQRKKVFVMSRFDGISNRDIAVQLGISLSTVENHLNKALKALKQCLYIQDVNLFLLFVLLWY